jgi:sterol desaturase/sphingolipid hydroxylase (fatty acid hydroxylase superfamily)
MESILIVLAIPVFLAFMGLELLVARKRGRRLYRFADSIANLGNGIGEQVIGAFALPLTVGVYAAIWAHARLATISERSVAAWVVLFFAVDLCYYVFHRAAHRINFLWAGHVVHHQSEEYNLSVALRQSWAQQLFQWAFYVPLALAGFPPGMFLVMTTLNTLYQFFIHTRLVGRLGPLEWVLNTPSHHRVHHGVNPRYIDRNYAGVLIIWDRLFGTFEPEAKEPIYGLVKPLGSFNPLWANVHYWAEMASMARRTRRLRDKVAAFVAPPEWRPADLGGPVVVPEPDRDGPTLVASSDPARDRWVLASFLVVVSAASWFIYAAGTRGTHAPIVIAAALAILAAVIGWGVIYAPRERQRAMIASAPRRSRL